jgi:hypothetical protein
MPVLMVMDWKGVTPEQYNQALEVVNWEGNVPPGGLYHVAGFDESGLHVVDVWESAEQFQSFVSQRLMPGVQQIGISGQPEVKIYPTHRIFTPGYTAKR